MAPVPTFRRLSLQRFSEDALTPQAELLGPAQKADGSGAPASGSTSAAFALDQVDVVFAESNEALVDTIKAELVSLGVVPDNIRTSEDGLGAMELILAAQAGEEGRPLMLLLDADMLDGQECASWAFSMASRGVLARCPYVVGYYAHGAALPEHCGGSRPADGGSDCQHVNLLLPLEAFTSEGSADDGGLRGCLGSFQAWWLRSRELPGARHRLRSLDGAEFLVADPWPICRMTLTMALEKLGVAPGRISEADSSEEAIERLRKVLEQPTGGPLVVFLGRQLPPDSGAQCAARMHELLQGCGGGGAARPAQCHAFLVCVSAADATSKIPGTEKEGFNCFLPRASNARDLSWVLQLCRLWWSEHAAAAERQAAPRPAERTACEDLGSAMQRWRERSERRKKARQAPSDGTSRGSYGAQMRRFSRAGMSISHQAVNKALEEAWSGQCSYEAETLLGSGSQAEVYRGHWQQPGRPGRPAAIKVFRMNPRTSTCFERELEISRSMQHPNLVAVFGGISHPVQMIVQEYCEGGSLHELLHKSTDGYVLTQQQHLKIALDVARGMVALHTADPPVVHRDLKSANILLATPVSGDTVPLARVADFGLARMWAPKDPAGAFMTKGMGSLRWMAPEVMTGNNYGLPADVYSYGSLIFELLSCSTPYGEDRSALPQPLETFVANGGRPDAAALGRSVVAQLAGFPEWLTGLMRQSWSQDPASRPTFPEIVQVLMEHGSDPLVGVPEVAHKPCGGVIQLRPGPRGGWERVVA